MSLFTVGKYKTIQACKNAIDYIEKKSNEIKEKCIDVEMSRKHWFKCFAPKTREEAWEKVRHSWYGSTAGRLLPFPPWLIGSDIEYRAKSLIKACEIAEGESVQLCEENANFVSKWSNKKE